MADEGAIAGSRGRRSGAVASSAGCHHVDERQVHQVHARCVAGVERSVPARKHRGEERAHEMDTVGGGVGRRRGGGELADLRRGEALEGA
jgi:hypothetical protein